MAIFGVPETNLSQNAQLAVLGENFLSSKHQDYQAVIAEFWSVVRG